MKDKDLLKRERLTSNEAALILCICGVPDPIEGMPEKRKYYSPEDSLRIIEGELDPFKKERSSEQMTFF